MADNPTDTHYKTIKRDIHEIHIQILSFLLGTLKVFK